MSSEASDGRRAGRFTDVVAVTALAAGAVGSVAFTLYAGLRVGSPRVLLVLFAGWVVLPFAILAVSYLVSRRRSVVAQLTLARSILVVSLASLALYAIAAMGSGRPKTAVFVLVAPMSLLLVGLAVPAAILAGRNRR